MQGDVNWPIAIIALCVLFPFGMIALLFPIKIIKWIMQVPFLIVRSLLGDSFLRPKTRQSLETLNKQPAQYSKAFGHQLFMIRITGFGILLFCLLGVIFLLLAYYK